MDIFMEEHAISETENSVTIERNGNLTQIPKHRIFIQTKLYIPIHIGGECVEELPENAISVNHYAFNKKEVIGFFIDKSYAKEIGLI